MAYNQCIAEITSGLQRKLSDDELLELMEDLQRRASIRKANNHLESNEESLLNAADELRADIEASKLVEKRNRLINIKVRSRILRYADEIDAATGDPSLAFEALTVGTVQNLKNGRMSIDTRTQAIRDQYMGGMINDLRKEGVLPSFNSKSMEREIAIELAEISKPASEANVGRSGNQDAVKIAKVIDKYRKVSLARENRAGSWIRPLPGYIVRQSHDMSKMRRAGFDEWKAFIEPRLDPRTFEGVDDPDKFLKSAYNGLVTGVHLKASGDQSDHLFAFKGPGNIAKRASQERKLHFKDAESWLDYNDRFGVGSVSESIIRDLERSARQTAVMEIFGTNPRAMFDKVREDLIAKHRDDIGKVERLQRQRLDWFMDWSDGTARIPGNVDWAQYSSAFRAVQSWSKLGGAFLSSLTDPALHVTELHKQGLPLLQAWQQAVVNYANGLAPGQRREFSDLIGVGLDGALGDMQARFAAGDTLPGWVTKGNRLFYKMNLLGPWTEASKRGLALMMSRRFAQLKNVAFDALPDQEKAFLARYNLSGPRWDAVRQAVRAGDDGVEFLMPDAIRDLPDDLIDVAGADELMGLKSPEAIARARNKIRDDLETQLRSLYIDRASFATSEPGAREQSSVLFGTKPGTVVGEAARFLMQFKSFPVTILMKPISEMVYANGYAKNWLQALRTGKADFTGLANLIVGSTVLGYVAMAAKDMAKGREPREPTDMKTFFAAMLQGGGLGLYGDFLFGEFTRYGQTPLESVAGPTVGLASDIVTLWSEARQGNDVAATALQLVWNNTPGHNLFYTKAALDYLLVFQMQEALNPGYLRRMERRMKKDQGQKYFIPPSQVVR
jgi:hypothetical protein